MRPRFTWFWLILAVGLFAFIVFIELPARRTAGQPERVLANFKTNEVTSIEILPKGLELGIRADRIRGGWQLTKPIKDPADSARIESLLGTLQELAPAAQFTERDLNDIHSSPEEAYGFNDPQATLIINNDALRLRVGRRTPPGNQVFLQVVGMEKTVFVVDAELLKWIPTQPDAWRDTALLDIPGLAFDRVTITNGTKALDLQRDAATGLWRMTCPGSWSARADSTKIELMVEQLQQVRIGAFVPDNPKPDLEALGLGPTALQVTLLQGTNDVTILQFGKTNDASQVFAQRSGRAAVFTVPQQAVAAWRAPLNDFRNPHLVALIRPLAKLSIQGDDSFSLVPQTNGSWRILPQNLQADTALVQGLLTNLSEMPIVDFTADVASELSLPKYGLAPPARQFAFEWEHTNNLPANSNVVVEIQFGTNNQDLVYARRKDESSVYAVKLADYQLLPSASWQMRDRRPWSFGIDDVAQVTLREDGRIRQLLHKDKYDWVLAPHSSGVIDGTQKLAIDSTIRGLIEISVPAWSSHGTNNSSHFGFSEQGRQITFELRNGEKHSIDFGNDAPSGLPYVGVTLDGDLWVFELPALLYRDVLSWLSVPPGPTSSKQ